MNESLRLMKQFALNDGIHSTAIPELKLIRSSRVGAPVHSVYKPSLCFLLQGSKDIWVGKEKYTYLPGEYIFCSIEIPVSGKVTEASASLPYLCLMIEWPLELILEVLSQNKLETSRTSPVQDATFVSRADENLKNAFNRLLLCLGDAREISVLSPLILREILFRVLQSREGNRISQLGISGSPLQRVSQAVQIIKKSYRKEIQVELLARKVGMSASSFHAHFKAVTKLSPLQYQKLLRLQEARKLLQSPKVGAARVGTMVGYESASQFCREYTKLFGHSPKAEAKLA